MYGGSVEGFAKLMNEKAAEMGLVNSHFVTPHGLDEKEHYTTAYELACMADYALEIPKFKEIVGSKTYNITINGRSSIISNTNELLGNLSGVYGIKTGFTNGAGRCLVTACKRGDLDIITVVLGAEYGVPELFPVFPFLRGVFRQENLLPDKALFFRVVMLYPVVIVVEAGTTQISGSGHGGAACAPADHLRFQMINRHILFTSFSFFCFSFVKEKMDGQNARPSLRQSCRWQVYAGGWKIAAVEAALFFQSRRR